MRRSKLTPLQLEVRSLRVINNQLWCCCDWDGIRVYDVNLIGLDTPLEIALSAQRCFDVAMLSDDLLIATASGLLQMISGDHAICRYAWC